VLLVPIVRGLLPIYRRAGATVGRVDESVTGARARLRRTAEDIRSPPRDQPGVVLASQFGEQEVVHHEVLSILARARFGGTMVIARRLV